MPETHSSPFFSIVVPVYNRFLLVEETIESILSQAFSDFEIIIVDDGSNDGSGPQLDDRYGKNEKIKIIHQENRERGAARNRGFSASSGEYVVFLDSDDRLLKDHLLTLHEFILANHRPPFIATKYEFLSNGRRKPSSVATLPEGNYDYHLFLDGNPLACNVCVRRANDQLSLFEEDRALAIKEDWLFFIKNLRHQQLYLVDRVTLLMLDHEDRSMRSGNELLIAKTALAREWIVKNADLPKEDLRRLDAHVDYFCAIHSYLDFQRIKPIRLILDAIRLGGVKKKYIVLLLKSIVGRKLILRFYHGT